MKRFLLAIALFLASSIPALAQGGLLRSQGFCTLGAQQPVVQGLIGTGTVPNGSTPPLTPVGAIQASYPGCQVTVYFTGTTNTAQIFSDNLLPPTPLVNPFTASSTDGSFGFYAAPSVPPTSCYDVVTNAAGMPVPFTYSYLCLGAGSGGGSTTPGLGDPGSNSVVFRNNLNLTRPATFTDILLLWAGTPSSNNFLRADGTLATPPGSLPTPTNSAPGPLAFYCGSNPSSSICPDNSATTDGTGHLSALGVQATTLAGTGTGGNGAVIANAGSGTTASNLVKIITGQLTAATTTDTAIPVFIISPTVTVGPTTVCAPGTTGNGCAVIFGQVNCVFDSGGVTANDYVVNSTVTNGRCMDAGSTLPSGPVCLVGTAATSAGANGTATVNADSFCYASTANIKWEIDLPFGICPSASTDQIAWDIPPSGTAATVAGCAGTNVNQGGAAFANSGNPALNLSFRLPQTMVTSPGADVYLTYSSAATSASFNMNVDLTCNVTNGTVSNDSAFSAGNWFAPGSQTTPGTGGFPQTVSATGLTWPANCLAGSMAHLRARRTDTAGAASITALTLHIVARRTAN